MHWICTMNVMPWLVNFSKSYYWSWISEAEVSFIKVTRSSFQERVPQTFDVQHGNTKISINVLCSLMLKIKFPFVLQKKIFHSHFMILYFPYSVIMSGFLRFWKTDIEGDTYIKKKTIYWIFDDLHKYYLSYW